MRKLAEANSDNFLNKCANNSLGDESCIMGIITLLISFVPLALFIYAFIKMTNFYKKLNFENGIILISGIEVLFLEFSLTTALDFFLQFFFFLQIFSISLLINKFSQLIKDMKSIFKKKFFFTLLNVINLAIFIAYIIYMIIPNDNSFFLNLVYKIFYLATTCLLSYFCIFLNKLISRHREENINTINLHLLNIDNDEESNSGNNKEIQNIENSNKTNNEENAENEKKRKNDEIFYNIKRKQNKCLYIINLSCSIIELCFTLVRFFIIHNDFLDDKFKIIPLTLTTEIIYYIYLLICLINVSVIYFCFYYFIRRTYSIEPKVFKKRPSKKLIDDEFIEAQKQSDENDNNNPDIISDPSNPSLKRKISDNYYCFSEISINKNDNNYNNNDNNNK